MVVLDNTNSVTVAISSSDFISLRSFLTSRNDALSDDKRLAFDTAVVSLRAACMAVVP